MSGFIINLASLPPGRSRLEVRASAKDLDLPSAEWPGDVEAWLDVDRSGELVTVRGRLDSPARLQCVRCLQEFDRPVEVDVTVVADRAGSARGLEDDLERDDYMKFHDGRQLDLRDAVREALLLEFPITPHCRETCLGLCPRCGADLNQGPCGCGA
jgi:uncharacterized protein